MTKLRVIGQNIQVNPAEQEFLTHMQKMFGCNEQEALEELIKYKREQAYMYETQGNFALARQIMQDIDEWDETRETEYNQRIKELSDISVDIILPK